MHTWPNVCRHTRAPVLAPGCVHNHAAETQNRMRACLARDVNNNERVRTCCAQCVRSCSMEIPLGPRSKIEVAQGPLQAYGKQEQRTERALHASLVSKDRVDGRWNAQYVELRFVINSIIRNVSNDSQTRLHGALRDTSVANASRNVGACFFDIACIT